MSTIRFASVALVSACLLTACGRSGGSHESVITPPVDSGLVATDLDGRWRITALEPRLVRTAGDPDNRRDPPPGAGLLPPVIDATITITDHECVDGNGLSLRRQDLVRNDAGDIEHYVNQVDERFAIYALRLNSDVRGRVDGGVYTLQMALGTVDKDHLLGLMYGRLVGAFVPQGAVVESMMLVRLERAP